MSVSRDNSSSLSFFSSVPSVFLRLTMSHQSTCPSPLLYLHLFYALWWEIIYMHVNKAAHTHTHLYTTSQRHGAERNFYQRSFVFQVVISSHCCCSANQESHTPMRVIILPSRGRKKKKNRPACLRQDADRCACMCVT